MSMNVLDRFAYGIADPQQEYPVALCDGCRSEMYEGEDYYEFDGGIYCSEDCLLRAVKDDPTYHKGVLEK